MNFRTKIFFYAIVIISICILSCGKNDAYTIDNKNTGSIKESKQADSISLNDKQKMILRGAKKCLEDKFSYDMDMAYYVLTYKDGVNTGKKVYPGGDLDPALGVCTDLIVRALRNAELFDMQKEIYEDMKINQSDYPMKRWGAKKPDSNIDHRRVPNLLVWFKKNFSEINKDEVMPADIVVWDMNGDSWSDHIGIVSDNNNYVIHNFPSPGYVAEEDVLDRWKIVGIYRIKN